MFRSDGEFKMESATNVDKTVDITKMPIYLLNKIQIKKTI